jgi:hypothetical protein
VRADTFRGYGSLDERGVEHEVVTREDSAAVMSVVPWVPIVFGNLERVLAGTHAKVGDRALQAYLDVVCYRFNRRALLAKPSRRGWIGWLHPGRCGGVISGGEG